MLKKTVKKQSSASRKYLLGSLAAVLVAVGIVAILELSGVTHLLHDPSLQSKDTASEQQRRQAAADADQKRQFIEDNGKPSGSDQGDQPADPADPADGTGGTQSSGQLTLTAEELSNGTVTVRTGLGAVNDGSCRLEVTRGTATTSMTADVIYAPAGSTCAGFSVPISSVGSGSWQIKLIVTPLSGSVISKSISQEVD